MLVTKRTVTSARARARKHSVSFLRDLNGNDHDNNNNNIDNDTQTVRDGGRTSRGRRAGTSRLFRALSWPPPLTAGRGVPLAAGIVYSTVALRGFPFTTAEQQRVGGKPVITINK